MGPGCFYPGNGAGGAARQGGWRLQWGRDVSIPEIRDSTSEGLVMVLLQWGRDVSIPEMQSLDVGHHATFLRFNGAGMFLSRKCAGPLVMAPVLTSFNGAGMFLSRK